jgi:N-acetylglucosamine-6-phosphate deacetylase
VWSGVVLQRVDTPACPPSPTPSDDWISAGWIDIQINGLAGVNFGDPALTVDQVRTTVQRLWSLGVTHFLPTLITDSLDRMCAALRVLAAARRESDLAASIPGIHLEGPFLSTEDGPRGAHPKEHCRPPGWDDWQRLQEAAEGAIRLTTLAPESPGALPFIERLARSGVCVAIGHTGADRQTILSAVDAGARLSTHLGNAAHDMLQRHHNYIYDQLGEDRLFASFIVDGHHLPPHLVQSFVRAKGLCRSILVSDAVQYTGLPPGVYDGGYRKFEVRSDGFIGVVGEPRLAGSGITLPAGIENLVRFAGVSLSEAIGTVTTNPAELLGLHRLGRLLPGQEASFVRFGWNDGRISVRETVVAGETVYREAR